MKDKIFGVLQRVFMLPIAVLPVAGLLLGIEVPSLMRLPLQPMAYRGFLVMEPSCMHCL